MVVQVLENKYSSVLDAQKLDEDFVHPLHKCHFIKPMAATDEDVRCRCRVQVLFELTVQNTVNILEVIAITFSCLLCTFNGRSLCVCSVLNKGVYKIIEPNQVDLILNQYY